MFPIHRHVGGTLFTHVRQVCLPVCFMSKGLTCATLPCTPTDTWFFILRKNFNQVTLLHVYHHSSITLVVGILIPHQYTGDVFLPILLNATVHVLMYSHYFVTSLKLFKPWWSPYLTSLQLIQVWERCERSCGLEFSRAWAYRTRASLSRHTSQLSVLSCPHSVSCFRIRLLLCRLLPSLPL